jgi:hypothetical protein
MNVPPGKVSRLGRVVSLWLTLAEYMMRPDQKHSYPDRSRRHQADPPARPVHPEGEKRRARALYASKIRCSRFHEHPVR